MIRGSRTCAAPRTSGRQHERRAVPSLRAERGNRNDRTRRPWRGRQSPRRCRAGPNSPARRNGRQRAPLLILAALPRTEPAWR